MSQQNFEASPGRPAHMQRSAAPVVKKQPLNVYTVMLIVAFICMMIASILFYIELSNFENWWNTGAQKIALQATDGLRQGLASLMSS